MALLSRFAANWQNFLPPLSIVGIVSWIVLFRNEETSERALFAALLVIYFIHQIEEHLWPGGFRQFTDAHMFHSGDDNWPVNIDGVPPLSGCRSRSPRSSRRRCAGSALPGSASL